MNYAAKFALVTLTFIVAPSSTVAASELHSELQQCAKVIDNFQRLTCFDMLVKSTTKTKKQAIVNETAVAPMSHQASVEEVAKLEVQHSTEQQVQEENFAKPELSKDNGPEVTTITFTIAKLKKMIRGEWQITFTNGQVWQQKGTDRLSLKVDQAVLISKGALGAYYLQKEQSNKRIQVKRLK